MSIESAESFFDVDQMKAPSEQGMLLNDYLFNKGKSSESAQKNLPNYHSNVKSHLDYQYQKPPPQHPHQ